MARDMTTTTYRCTERRTDVRLASDKAVDVAIVDQYDQPVAVLGDAKAINVSAGGMMLLSQTPAHAGARLRVGLPTADQGRGMAQAFNLEALACHPQHDHQHTIHCKLVTGRIPARLIYNW